MATKISQNKWMQETSHGRVIIKISDRGIHVQNITDTGDGIIAHDERVHSFQDVLDFSEGQIQIPIHHGK